ncbi:MAG: LD-carboxypeptidase [Bacteroidetes bacterium 4572_114]|nr:MAG: LD-carboxypeptidase [Bacteroidetes bacterium 4572_114]
MIIPPYLEKGDTIGIVSAAKSIPESKIENAIKVIEDFGFKARPGKNVTSVYHQFAGTDEERASDFQEMLDDSDVKMILSSRGGYGSVRIIDRLDFDNFLKSPKWIVGFSDITTFHSHLFSVYGIESLHATMPLNFPEKGMEDLSLNLLMSAVMGEKLNYEIDAHQLNRPGKTEARIVGGNLAILCSMLGSRSDPDTDGKILFIEEVGENLYRLDRMMWTLKRAGKLGNLAGLVVGGMTYMEDNDVKFGKSAQEIVAEAVSNYPLIMGRNVKLDVTVDQVTLKLATR